MKTRHLSLKDRNTYRSLEDVVGCKWSAGVVAALAAGVRRPGQLERYIPGISTKILNERLRKLCTYALVMRTEYPERLRRVEYRPRPRPAQAGAGDPSAVGTAAGACPPPGA